MRRRTALVLTLAGALAAAARGEPAPERTDGGLFDPGALRDRKEPIVVTSDTLEYDYKANVVVYRGTVQATQGPVKLSSDTLTVTFGDADVPDAGAKTSAARDRAFDVASRGRQRLHEIVAAGNVRIDHGTRWATGGRAVFDQSQRTLVLTESPKLHDGANEVVGDRVVVYLDEDRSVVEGGRKRVKAVLYPDREHGLAPAGPTGGSAGTARAESSRP
jgi:lipopolysaccharide export system protein LptA